MADAKLIHRSLINDYIVALKEGKKINSVQGIFVYK